MANILKGGCLCRAITFEASGEPNWVAYCHCESCRRTTSSPATAFFGVPYSGFRYTTGTPQVYRSSPGVRRSFCGSCGSPMAFEAESLPDEIHLYVTALDNPEALCPRGHVHTGEQLSWFEVDDDLPRFKAAGTGNVPDHRGPRRS